MEQQQNKLLLRGVWVMWAGFEGNDDCSKKRWYVRPLYKSMWELEAANSQGRMST